MINTKCISLIGGIGSPNIQSKRAGLPNAGSAPHTRAFPQINLSFSDLPIALKS